MEDDDECPICFNDVGGHRLIPCNHRVCRECATRWLSEHDSCPLCRRDASPFDSEKRGRDHRGLIEVVVHASHFRGRNFSMIDDTWQGEGVVRFVWEDDPEWLYVGSLHLQHGDRITHVDGFEVQNARWTFQVVQRAIRRNRIFRCYVVLEGRLCQAPSLRETLMVL